VNYLAEGKELIIFKRFNSLKIKMSFLSGGKERWKIATSQNTTLSNISLTCKNKTLIIISFFCFNSIPSCFCQIHTFCILEAGSFTSWWFYSHLSKLSVAFNLSGVSLSHSVTLDQREVEKPSSGKGPLQAKSLQLRYWQ